jgi:hypothetical protein
VNSYGIDWASFHLSLHDKSFLSYEKYPHMKEYENFEGDPIKKKKFYFKDVNFDFYMENPSFGGTIDWGKDGIDSPYDQELSRRYLMKFSEDLSKILDTSTIKKTWKNETTATGTNINTTTFNESRLIYKIYTGPKQYFAPYEDPIEKEPAGLSTKWKILIGIGIALTAAGLYAAVKACLKPPRRPV